MGSESRVLGHGQGLGVWVYMLDPLTAKQLLAVARLLAEELNERLKNRQDCVSNDEVGDWSGLSMYNFSFARPWCICMPQVAQGC